MYTYEIAEIIYSENYKKQFLIAILTQLLILFGPGLDLYFAFLCMVINFCVILFIATAYNDIIHLYSSGICINKKVP